MRNLSCKEVSVVAGGDSIAIFIVGPFLPIVDINVLLGPAAPITNGGPIGTTGSSPSKDDKSGGS